MTFGEVLGNVVLKQLQPFCENLTGEWQQPMYFESLKVNLLEKGLCNWGSLSF